MVELIEIQHLSELQHLVTTGFTDWQKYGDVTVSDANHLLLFNYNEQTQLKGRWNFFERISRGLIIDKSTGEVIARGFDKFFNWLEDSRCSTGKIVSITEKVDGSLGTLYRQNNTYGIATRHSLKSEQALWATQFLQQHYDLSNLPHELTLLFEIVYPDNRVIADYGDREDLILISARNRFTGDYLSLSALKSLSEQYGFSTPKIYDFHDIDDILAQLPIISGHEEGFVVEFSDGQRFKFKGKRYLELHGIAIGLSFRSVLNACRLGREQEFRSQIPEEFWGQFDKWLNQIQDTFTHTKEAIETAFNTIPINLSRKELATWIQTHHKSLGLYLFAKIDGKPIEPMIYRNAFKDNE